jgi:hypothetical protein
MRIAFNLLDCGLGNNGGSQTIIRMADKLFRLGHEVNILINQPNRFTWFDIPDGLILKIKNTIPQYDVMIATGCSTVKSTLAYNLLPIYKKFYWIRAIEDWAMSIDKLMKGYRSGLNLMVNSEWQQRYIFEKTGIFSDLIYSGIPFDEINEVKKELKESGIFNTGHTGLWVGALASKKSRKRFIDVVDIAYKLKEKNLLSKLLLVSNESEDELNNLFDLSKINGCYELFKQPSMYEKLKIMHSCDVWLSTTINEGLHIPPLEAALCGCLLLSRNGYKSGISDYCIDNLTSFNYTYNDDAVERVGDYLKINLGGRLNLKEKMKENFNSIIYGKIGSVEVNARRMLRVLGNG